MPLELPDAIKRVREYFNKHVLRDCGVMKQASDTVLKAAESTLAASAPKMPKSGLVKTCVVYRNRLGHVQIEDLQNEPLKIWKERHAVQVICVVPVLIPIDLLKTPELEAVEATR